MNKGVYTTIVNFRPNVLNLKHIAGRVSSIVCLQVN